MAHYKVWLQIERETDNDEVIDVLDWTIDDARALASRFES